MRRVKKKRIKLLLLIVVLCITLGYAALRTGLNINGITNVSSASWDVHFENVQNSQRSNVVANPAPSAPVIDKVTTISYTVSLVEPGDIYEFTVNAVNDGSIDAMIEEITSTMKIGNNDPVTITNSNLPAYLAYSVTYSDDRVLGLNHELKANSRETYKVRVEYRTDIDVSDLPATNQDIVFNFSVIYKQADDNVVVVPRSQFLTGEKLILK